MAHIAHPLLGDQTYGGRPRPPKNASEAFTEVLRNFKRQALHAVMLRLAHPITGEMMEWYAPLPDDFVELLHALKADYLEHKTNWIIKMKLLFQTGMFHHISKLLQPQEKVV